MKSREITEIYEKIRRDDQQTIENLINLNERIIWDLKDLISTTKEILLEKKKAELQSQNAIKKRG